MMETGQAASRAAAPAKTGLQSTLKAMSFEQASALLRPPDQGASGGGQAVQAKRLSEESSDLAGAAVDAGTLAAWIADHETEVEATLTALRGQTDGADTDALVAIYEAVGDGSPALKKLAFELAFSIDLAEVGGDLELPLMTKMGLIFKDLPADHRPKEWRMRKGGADQTTTSGTYNPEANAAIIDYGGAAAADVLAAEYVNAGYSTGAKALDEEEAQDRPEDALAGLTAFDTIVRHEMGHKAFDVTAGAGLTNSPAGGNWASHTNPKSVFAEFFSYGILADLTATLTAQLDALDKRTDGLDAVVTQWANSLMDSALSNPKKLRESLAIKAARGRDITVTAVPFRGKKDAKKAAREQRALDLEAILPLGAMAGSVFMRMLSQAIAGGGAAYFNFGEDPIECGGRIFHKTGVGNPKWASFDRAAWAQRVSMYQFRAPAEWFAEMYAAVNAPDKASRDKAKASNAAAVAWMKANGCAKIMSTQGE